MKRILIFSTAYFPLVGGAEVAIREITERLAPGYEFDLITIRFSRKLAKREKIGAVNVYRVGFGIGLCDKILAPVLGAFKARALNARHGYDTYWAMMVTYMSGAAFVANILSRKKIPIILTLQEGDSEEHLTKRWFGLLNLSWKLALKHASHLTVISSYLGARAKRLGYGGAISIVPNGVDVELFSRLSEEDTLGKIRGEWSLTQDNVVLFTASRLVEKNGLADVIRALALLPERFVFVVAGEGPLREELEALAGEAGVGTRVRFLGLVPYKELPRLLRGSEIFIRPSLSEGMGNSFIEAFAAWVPVVATQQGGIADFLFDPFLNPDMPPTGRAVPVRDPQAIAEAVLWYRDQENRETVRQMTENAHDLAKERYAWSGIAASMAAVFEKP